MLSLPKISGQFMPIAKEATMHTSADNGFLPAGQVKFLLDKAEHNREYHKHDGDHACRTVGGCGSGKLR